MSCCVKRGAGIVLLCTVLTIFGMAEQVLADNDNHYVVEGTVYTTEQKPGRVELLEPSGAQDSLNLTYRWRADADATWYRLYVRRDGITTWDRWYKVGHDDISVSEGVVSVYLAGHRAGAGYEWWVQTGSDTEAGLWSAGMRFNTQDGKPRNRVTGTWLFIFTHAPELVFTMELEQAETGGVVEAVTGSMYVEFEGEHHYSELTGHQELPDRVILYSPYLEDGTTFYGKIDGDIMTGHYVEEIEGGTGEWEAVRQ